MSVPPGGAATTYGILYQMLWSLLESFVLQIKDCDSDPTGENASRAFLILEPHGGGGDLLVMDGNVEVVQQLKARSLGGTWSLREVVVDVLPDLYRAVDLDRPQRFEFVTEGRMGDWGEAYDFFRRLGRQPVPGDGNDVLSVLDASRTISFGGALAADGRGPTVVTERELFSQMEAILRQREPARSEEIDLTRRKLWVLLAHLEFRSGEAAGRLRALLRHRLRAVVESADDIDRTLGALVEDLARRASQGGARVETAAFLRGHGLPGLPLTDWHKLVTRGVNLMERRLSLFHYRSAEDVRSAPAVDALQPWLGGDSPFLVLTGESGQGKTWELARLAHTLAPDTPAVLLESSGRGLEDKDEAARLFWQDIANHDGTRDLGRIARRVRETVPLQAGCWLFVLVDNVRTNAEAQELHRALAPVPGIRVAFTAPPEVADYFAGLYGNDARVIPVADFTDDELRRYVVGDDPQAWHDIPPDIRAIIRRPLLADLYRQLTLDGERAPDTEYKLYARYYNQRAFTPLREHFPAAFAGLKRAAIAVWRGEPYPWSLEQLEAFGLLDSRLVLFLLEIGWLRRDERQSYQVWHDRLLNWQVAEALADAIERGQEDAAAFGRRCASDLHRVPAEGEAQRLGYVLMDVIWLLAQRGPPAADALDAILGQMEDDFRTIRIVYEHLLPTAGPEIAPALFRRLEAADPTQARRPPIVSALAALDAAAVAPGAIHLLNSEDKQLRRGGMTVLARRPSADALDPLWLHYVRLLQEQEADNPEDQQEDLWERLSLWPALEACARLDPTWLERKIQSRPPFRNRLAGVLAALLQVVPGGRPIWLRLKGILRSGVEGGGGRQFADTAYHWRDGDEAEWLQARTSVQADSLGAFCLRALTRVAPDAALAALGNLPARELAPTRKWTVSLLWACRPEQTSARLRELMREQPGALWDYARALDDLPTALDGDTLSLLLDALLPRMSAGAAEALRLDLRPVATAATLPLLRRLQERAGTPWEGLLTRLLVEDDPQPMGWRDVVHKDADQALYKTGGAGFTRLINHRLANGDVYARREAIDASFKRPDAETVRLLESLADGGQDAGRDAGDGLDAYLAQLALARIGAWRSVVETLVSWQGNSNRGVLFARWGMGPLTDEEMGPALAALRDDPRHPGAIIALGFGQRTDYLGHIGTALAEDNPEEYSDVTNACLWALTALPQVPPEAVDLLVRRLKQPDGRWLVIPLLVREGGGSASQALLHFLRNELAAPHPRPYPATLAADVSAAARFLLRNPSTHDDARALCRARIERDVAPDYVAQHLIEASLPDVDEADFLPFLPDDPRTRGFLAQKAFEDDRSTYYVGDRARSIRALAAFSPSDAYAAALRVLKNRDANDRDQAPALLLKLDYSRAIDDLVSHLTVERRTYLRRTCARALSEAKAAEELRDRHLTSPNPARRAAACFALGFTEPTATAEAAVRACLGDDDVQVFEAACGAVCQLDAARCVNELAAAYIKEHDIFRRWVLLDAALEIGDVFKAGWLRRMLHDAMPTVVDYVQEQVGKRRDQERQEAGSEDWRNHVE